MNYNTLKILLVTILLIFTASLFADAQGSLSHVSLIDLIDPDIYIVKPGDIFLIQTIAIDTLSIRTPVLPDGTLNLFPFSESISITGRSLTDATKSIENTIGSNFFIQLVYISSIRFHVMGAVATPGEFITEPFISLTRALEVAGDATANASRRIGILRNNEVFHFDLNDFFLNNNISQNPFILHNDVILVNLAQNFVTVTTNAIGFSDVEFIELVEGRKSISTVLNQLSKRHSISNLQKFTVERNSYFKSVSIDFELQSNDRLFISTIETFVYVHGHVETPSAIDFNGFANALFYIAQSGGLTSSASRSRILITQSDGVRRPYKGQPIRPGDIIYVPESSRERLTAWLSPVGAIMSIVSTIIIMANMQ